MMTLFWLCFWVRRCLTEFKVYINEKGYVSMEVINRSPLNVSRQASQLRREMQ